MSDEAATIYVKVRSADLLFSQIRVITHELLKLALEPLEILLNLNLVDFYVSIQIIILILLVDRVQGHEPFLRLHREAGGHAAAEILRGAHGECGRQNTEVATICTQVLVLERVLHLLADISFGLGRRTQDRFRQSLIIFGLERIVHPFKVLKVIVFILRVIFAHLGLPSISQSDQSLLMLLLLVQHVEVVAPSFDIVDHVSFKYLPLQPYLATFEQVVGACVQGLASILRILRPRIRRQHRKAADILLFLGLATQAN